MKSALRTTLFVLVAWPLAVGATPESLGKRPPLDPNKMICRSTTQIGSRLDTKRVCRTVAEWKEAEKEQREFVRGLSNSSSNCRGDLPDHHC
jgi:hypothetical protein